MTDKQVTLTSKDEVERWKLIPERIAELRKCVDEILSAHNTHSCIAIRDMLSEALRPIVETPQPAASKLMTPGQRETHVRWLTVMLEYYSGEEATLRARLDEREVWGEGHENEWRRYQAEAAALRAAIEALHPSDETPAPPSKDEVLEAIRAGGVTYPPEVLPTGRWMPVEETAVSPTREEVERRAQELRETGVKLIPNSWRCEHGTVYAWPIAVAICGCERPSEETPAAQYTQTQIREFCGYLTGYLTELGQTHPGSVWDGWESYLRRSALKAASEPHYCIDHNEAHDPRTCGALGPEKKANEKASAPSSIDPRGSLREYLRADTELLNAMNEWKVTLSPNFDADTDVMNALGEFVNVAIANKLRLVGFTEAELLHGRPPAKTSPGEDPS